MTAYRQLEVKVFKMMVTSMCRSIALIATSFAAKPPGPTGLECTMQHVGLPGQGKASQAYAQDAHEKNCKIVYVKLKLTDRALTSFLCTTALKCKLGRVADQGGAQWVRLKLGVGKVLEMQQEAVGGSCQLGQNQGILHLHPLLMVARHQRQGWQNVPAPTGAHALSATISGSGVE